MIDLKDYKCLALDIGGVVCADTWEMLFLAPRDGLAAKYKLDPADVLKMGDTIWHLYAYSDRDEDEYWQTWEDDLGIDLDRDYIEKLKKKVLWVDSTAEKIIGACFARGMDVAIVSNSTSFFFPAQMQQSGIAQYLPRIKKYLSHELGYKKAHEKGGLRRLAADVDAACTLFLDDRKDNVKTAEGLGFKTLFYDRGTHKTLGSVIRI